MHWVAWCAPCLGPEEDIPGYSTDNGHQSALLHLFPDGPGALGPGACSVNGEPNNCCPGVRSPWLWEAKGWGQQPLWLLGKGCPLGLDGAVLREESQADNGSKGWQKWGYGDNNTWGQPTASSPPLLPFHCLISGPWPPHTGAQVNGVGTSYSP